mmetsp:Transcript_13379/g.41933  ORF Transcript_13379/g.41933 Transcript_13379/m.41933 type:complete len:217 (-) Transcript_13379:160-810(-)
MVQQRGLAGLGRAARLVQKVGARTTRRVQRAALLGAHAAPLARAQSGARDKPPRARVGSCRARPATALIAAPPPLVCPLRRLAASAGVREGQVGPPPAFQRRPLIAHVDVSPARHLLYCTHCTTAQCCALRASATRRAASLHKARGFSASFRGGPRMRCGADAEAPGAVLGNGRVARRPGVHLHKARAPPQPGLAPARSRSKPLGEYVHANARGAR